MAKRALPRRRRPFPSQMISRNKRFARFLGISTNCRRRAFLYFLDMATDEKFLEGDTLQAARYGHAIAVSEPYLLSAASTEHADLRRLLAHWEKLKAARPSGEMPLRAVASGEIGPLLKFTHLCDVVDGGADFRFRIVGMSAFPNISALAGKLVSEHPDMGARHRFPILMREVVKTQRPVRGISLRHTLYGKFLFESIWLPFGTSQVQQILGMLVATSRER